MRITKDEAAILLACLENSKYDLPYKHGVNVMETFDILGGKLSAGCKDKRRVARYSDNTLRSIIKRYHALVSGTAVPVKPSAELEDDDPNIM